MENQRPSAGQPRSAATLNTSGAINRISKEINHIQEGSDVSLAVAYHDSDLRRIKALIIGPPETPYEYGFFEFDVKFPKDYPIKSPHVRCVTTNGGRTRFNPNIYAEGKVCLSILGTWRGERGEEWSSAQGLESMLLSIQSLMSPNPYENEPGFEHSQKDEPEPAQYIAKIRHETIRISILQRLEVALKIGNHPGPSRPSLRSVQHHLTPVPPESLYDESPGTLSAAEEDSSSESGDGKEPKAFKYDAEATFRAWNTGAWDPFIELMKTRFLWYYDTYVRNITEAISVKCEGSRFATMPFEYHTNGMDGKFEFKDLKKRLDLVLDALNKETESWATEGQQQVGRNTALASQLAFQFKQLEHRWNKTQYTGCRMELALPDPTNPFLWQLTLFGTSAANLDGGIFNIIMAIPPDFPGVLPRVTFQTPIYHRQVNSFGALCYFAKKPEEMGSHLEAIVAAIEDENPNFDPRLVIHPEAFELYWGGELKRKQYSRKLRRSAQDSRQRLREQVEELRLSVENAPAELAAQRALARHQSPQAPLTFMHHKQLTSDGHWEDVVLDRHQVHHFFEELISPILDESEELFFERRHEDRS